MFNNKFAVALAVSMLVSAAVEAKTHPVPPKKETPAPMFIADPNVYGAVVKDGQVLVRAPVGSDIDIDGDSIEVNTNKSEWDRVLPWNWF